MQQARRSERDFTRERALPLQRLVPLLLNFRKGTNRDELEQFFETITDDPTSVTPVSEAAFCRARQKLKPEALVTLNNVLLDSANQQIAQQRWRGLRVLAVDGSTGRLPDFPAIEEYFGKPSGSGVPLARFSRLFDVLNDQILHADMVPYATGERELAAEYLLYSRPDELFLYDRGYPAFWLFAFHAQEQRHYCARVRHDFHSEVKAFVADGAKERIVVLTPNTASARQCREGHLPADPLRVRLIWVELESGEVEVLITSLLDTKAYPYRAFAKLLLNDEIRIRMRKNVVQARAFSEMLEEAVNKYHNRAIAAAEVIEELINLAKEMREAQKRGENLGLTEDEIAFYDALEINDSAVKVLGDDTLKMIARELVQSVRRSVSIDWAQRENARAKIRVMVKRILRQFGYPPDKQERATELVLEQAEVLCREWVVQ